MPGPISLVGQYRVWPCPGTAGPNPWNPNVGQHLRQNDSVVALAAGDYDRQRSALTVNGLIDLRRQSASGASDPVTGRFTRSIGQILVSRCSPCVRIRAGRARRMLVGTIDGAVDGDVPIDVACSVGVSQDLGEDELAVWLQAVLSELTPESPALKPVEVLDPTDGYLIHLYGLCLSVAASLMRPAPKLLSSAERSGNHEVADHAKGFLTAVDRLMTPQLEAAVSDEYMASHWVATFAWESLVLRNH